MSMRFGEAPLPKCHLYLEPILPILISMTSTERRFTLLTILFVVLTSVLFARAQSEDLIVNDPEVRSGVLANGLTYYVRANDQPAGTAELRLAIAAGSLQEDKDQLGLAHFLEHMLFNGTEKYPANQIIDVLESFGMDFGPDINAYTTFDRTMFRLTVKSDDESQFLTGLDILEQWAFKATLDKEQFEKERGVIQEEWRVGRGAQARLQDEIYPVLFQGSRYAQRQPIGDMDIVMNAPLEALTRFYKDWYRPDLMAVFAVGDFDPDKTVELIRERFGGHSNPKNPSVREEYPIPPHKETLVKVAHDPEATQTSVQLYVKYDPPETRFRPDVRQDLAQQLFFVMLNQRLKEISRREEAPFLYGYGFTNDYTKDTSLAGMAAAVSEEGVLDGLDALVAEAERVQRYGFLESELERAKRDVMSFFENYWEQRNDMDSADFLQPLIDNYFMGDSYPSVDWQWKAVQDLLPGISLEEVADVADVLLSDENRVVIVSGPSVPAITDLTDGDILEVLHRVEERPLDPWKDLALNGPLVADPPAPGHIVRRSLVPGTDIQDWKLSNGARVLVKKTDFRSDEILFRAISPGGSSRVDDENYISSQFASDAVDQGGLGEFSADNLRKVLAGKNVELNSFIQDTYEGFSGSTTPADLETLLQLLYLNQSDPRRDPVAWDALMNRTAESLKNRDSSPMTLYGDLLWETLYDGHERSRPLTLDRLDEADLDAAMEVFTQRFTGGGDFTYVFVGDIDTEELAPLVERWIGGLPAGNRGEGWMDRGMRNVKGVREVSLEAGTEPLSVVTQVWTGEWDGSFVERYRIQSLASALEMRLTRAIREDSGGTYSVSVFPHLNLRPNKDYRFFVQYSCDPERVEELSRMVKDVVTSWRSTTPDEKFAADVAASQKRSLDENLERNSWWIGQIVFAVAADADPEELMDRYALYDTLTPEVLSAAANRYLNDESYVEAVLYPEDKTE